jgi:small subunit ribosomal protein S1
VTKVVTFGAFVEILPGVEGLVHISELAQHHVENPREVVSQGETVRAKVIEMDAERRRLSLSLKRVEEGEQVRSRETAAPLGLSEEVFTEPAEAPASSEVDGTGADAVASEPDAVASEPDAVASEPDAVASEPDAVASESDGVAEEPTAGGGEVSAGGDDVTADGDEVTAGADELTTDGDEVTAGADELTADAGDERT